MNAHRLALNLMALCALSMNAAAAWADQPDLVVHTINLGEGEVVRIGTMACGKGADFVAAQGKLQFAKGEASKVVAIETCSDAQKEGLEGVTLSLSPASNAALASANAVGAITD